VGDCSIRTLPATAIALVMARKGCGASAAAAAERAFGTPLPSLPRIVSGGALDFVWCGPERWLVIAPSRQAADAGGMEAMLEPVFAGLASVSDQSGSRVLIEVSGTSARDVLAREVPVDLHPRAFEPGHTALCRAGYVALLLWQRSADPAFVLAVPRSYGEGVRRSLLASAEGVQAAVAATTV